MLEIYKVIGDDMQKNVLILEDKETVRLLVKKLVQEVEPTANVFLAEEISQAYSILMNKRIDLFLVDIILDTSNSSDVSGLKFVAQLRKIEQYAFTPVIIISTLEDQELHSYRDLHCYGYVEKPFDSEEVKKLLSDALKYQHSRSDGEMLFFRSDGIYHAVEKDKVVYAEIINHVLHIHTAEKDVMKIPYITLKKLMEEIDNEDIFRCSRNTVVNKRYISNVDITNRFIQFKNGLGKVEIGLTYKNSVKEILSSRC